MSGCGNIEPIVLERGGLRIVDVHGFDA